MYRIVIRLKLFRIVREIVRHTLLLDKGIRYALNYWREGKEFYSHCGRNKDMTQNVGSYLLFAADS